MSEAKELDLTSIITTEKDGVECFKQNVDIFVKQYLDLLTAYLKQKQKYQITRKDICKKSKLSYETIFNVDTCRSIPRIDTLLKLFDSVDCYVEFKIIDKRQM